MLKREDRKAEPDPSGLSDRSLLRRIRTGSEDAATQLYLRYAKRLLALARTKCSPDLAPRLDPDDIVQSVFRTFFRRAVQGAYDVPDAEDLWKLFLVIGLNKIQAVGAYHRAAKRDVRLSAGDEGLETATQEAGDVESLSILQMAIEEVMSELTPAHREIVNLRIEGHEVAAIAERLGRPKRSVERVLQGFRKMLAGLINKEE